MATNYLTAETWTVTETAAKYRRTTARIRQICIEHDIGKLVKNKVRLLDSNDVKRIGQIISERGWRT